MTSKMAGTWDGTKSRTVTACSLQVRLSTRIESRLTRASAVYTLPAPKSKDSTALPARTPSPRPSISSPQHAQQPGESGATSLEFSQSQVPTAVENHTEDWLSKLTDEIDAAIAEQGHADKDEEQLVSHIWGQAHQVFGPSDKDPFLVCSFLGLGSVGAVEEVTMTKGSTISCVRKKIPLPRHLRKHKLTVIQQEVDILKSLAHVHIVKLLGTYEDAIQVNRPGSYCLLMLPVGDGDLRVFLDQCSEEPVNDRSFSLGWLQQWFICLSSALHYMHSQGVRHQDIKPSNIVHRGGSVYFTDFSSSSRFEIGQATSTETPFRSTAMYAAPEVTAKYLDDGTLQRHGRGSDIFALGCVFCEMLSVLTKRSVQSFHDYLVQDEVNNGPLLYSRKLMIIDKWFDVDKYDWYLDQYHHLDSVQIFEDCIKPMLKENRDERCDAATALQKFKNSKELQQSFPKCTCAT
jgi:serine/threonine protein kinase